MISDRIRLLVELCPKIHPIVDVGADHGQVARAVGAVAVERLPHRMGRWARHWVIADGMTPFCHVGTAVIAGIGARRIISIIEAGPRPQALLLHAPDDPPVLRRYLAAHGWHLDVERLACEGKRIAEIICASKGNETAAGLVLDYGPRLLEEGDPLLATHLDKLIAKWQRVADATANRAVDAHQRALTQIAFLNDRRNKGQLRL